MPFFRNTCWTLTKKSLWFGLAIWMWKDYLFVMYLSLGRSPRNRFKESKDQQKECRFHSSGERVIWTFLGERLCWYIPPFPSCKTRFWIFFLILGWSGLLHILDLPWGGSSKWRWMVCVVLIEIHHLSLGDLITSLFPKDSSRKWHIRTFENMFLDPSTYNVPLPPSHPQPLSHRDASLWWGRTITHE